MEPSPSPLGPFAALPLLVILFGPIVYVVVQAIRHRDSPAPEDEQSLEAPSMMQSLRDWLDTRSGGKGF